MEYAPLNVWPKGTPQGDYLQLALGPYDYHAIAFGYGYVPNAVSPEAEVPQLRKIASQWSDPRYRFASDEDADFTGGHAVDPRVERFDLTDAPLDWERGQLAMLHRLLDAVDARFPLAGDPYEEARRAFLLPLRYYVRTATMPANVIGGEYLSRSNAGDPNSGLPLQPVPRAQELRAWRTLQEFVFSDAAWKFKPSVLNRLTYDEVSSLAADPSFIYAPTPRHDVAVVQIAEQTQDAVLNQLFAPLTLQRIDDLSTKYAPGSTMTLVDLFDWTRDGIFGDLRAGAIGRAGIVRRNAQMQFAKRLSAMWLTPTAGMPVDAQVLARRQLEYLRADTQTALGRLSHADELTRAHVEALAAVARQALDARATVAGSRS